MQPALARPMSVSTGVHTEALQKLRELTSGIHIAMLTSIEDDGTLHSRPMGV